MKILKEIVNINDNIEKDYYENFVKFEDTFKQILEVCNNKFDVGTGSYLFDGRNYEYCEKMYQKQVLLFEKVKNINSVLEIGTYMGHSLFIMLISNPKLKITCIDIDDKYSLPVTNFLREKFNADIEFIKGDSISVLPNLNKKFDLFHIDGTHKLEFVNKEFQMCKKISSSNIMNVIFDDYDTVIEMENIIKKEHTILEQITPNCNWRNSYLRIKL